MINKRNGFTATFIVHHSEELLSFLLNKCKTSRNNVKRLLANRQVVVNGVMVRQYNFMLEKEDEVKIAKYPIEEEKNSKFKKERLPFSILYEDDDFIAIDKPQGLLSIDNGKEEQTAYRYVSRYVQEKDKNQRVYIIHRIDKETSGVLVFTKNKSIHSMLRLRWNQYVRVRQYYALVEGRLEPATATIQNFLAETENGMMYVSKNPNELKAVLHYRVVKQNKDYSLLEVEIDTGRKNQIRVQLKHLGHGIVGDKKYGYEKDPLHRLGLHAIKLEFIHPITKAVLSISSPLPKEFLSVF